MPLFLDLRKDSGLIPGQSFFETGGRSLIEFMTPNIGVCRNADAAYAYWLTSTETPPRKYYLNCGERPTDPNPTKLSQILEQNPDPKYNLSAKACQGILNRATRRGKELPKMLQDALEHQAQVTSGNVDTSSELSDEDG
jgi:hypothetical protein